MSPSFARLRISMSGMFSQYLISAGASKACQLNGVLGRFGTQAGSSVGFVAAGFAVFAAMTVGCFAVDFTTASLVELVPTSAARAGGLFVLRSLSGTKRAS